MIINSEEKRKQIYATRTPSERLNLADLERFNTINVCVSSK